MESILISDLAGFSLDFFLLGLIKWLSYVYNHIEERIERVEVEGTIGSKKHDQQKKHFLLPNLQRIRRKNS